MSACNWRYVYTMKHGKMRLATQTECGKTAVYSEDEWEYCPYCGGEIVISEGEMEWLKAVHHL